MLRTPDCESQAFDGNTQWLSHTGGWRYTPQNIIDNLDWFQKSEVICYVMHRFIVFCSETVPLLLPFAVYSCNPLYALFLRQPFSRSVG